jgi:uncharacterized protein (TIGR03435 family)
MMQKVLVERLGFKYHLVDRETPVYNMVQGSGDLKLVPATEPEPATGTTRTGMFKRKSATLAAFAGFLAQDAGRPVVDKTGIEGSFEFDIDWPELRLRSADAPGVVRAGLKRLGLKLESAKEMRRILVVDNINKIPTAN